MLHNVADLTDVLSNMVDEGLPMPRELVSRLSPYMREHIRRFGQYTTARMVYSAINRGHPREPNAAIRWQIERGTVLLDSR